MKTPSKVRVATTRDGKQYVVNYIDFGSRTAPKADPVVHCWGEVLGYKGGQRRHHSDSKAFPQSTVTLSEVDGGAALSVRLFTQADAAAAAGELPGYVDAGTSRAQRRAHEANVRAFSQVDERGLVEAVYRACGIDRTKLDWCWNRADRGTERAEG